MTTLYLGHPKNYDPEAVANLLQTKQIRSIANLDNLLYNKNIPGNTSPS